MRAIDLTIGNWVMTRDNHPAQVVGLTVDSVETTAKEGYYNEVFFSPIPLTLDLIETWNPEKSSFIDDLETWTIRPTHEQRITFYIYLKTKTIDSISLETRNLWN